MNKHEFNLAKKRLELEHAEALARLSLEPNKAGKASDAPAASTAPQPTATKRLKVVTAPTPSPPDNGDITGVAAYEKALVANLQKYMDSFDEKLDTVLKRVGVMSGQIDDLWEIEHQAAKAEAGEEDMEEDSQILYDDSDNERDVLADKKPVKKRKRDSED